MQAPHVPIKLTKLTITWGQRSCCACIRQRYQVQSSSQKDGTQWALRVQSCYMVLMPALQLLHLPNAASTPFFL